MVVTLSGENHYRLQAELSGLVQAFTAEYGNIAVEHIDGDEANLDRASEALTSLPFLAAKKMVVLRTPSKILGFSDAAEQLLGDIPDFTEVIIVEPKLDKRLSYYKYLRAKTDFRICDELNEIELVNWLVIRAKEQSATLSSSDARYLIERVGVQQQRAAGELDKLALYDPVISRKTIDLLTDSTPQSTIFELIDAAFSGRSKRAVELYEEQRALAVEPQQIIAMLTWQLHILALIKTAGNRSPEKIAQEAKLSPYVVKKSAFIARKVTIARLKANIAELLDIDTKSKRSALNLDDALKFYLLQL